MTWRVLKVYVPLQHFGFPFSLGLQEIPLEQLSDIKAKSIVEWIANDLVRRSIIKHFRLFLTTYTDDRGDSVYGQRIRSLGESEQRTLLYVHGLIVL